MEEEVVLKNIFKNNIKILFDQSSERKTYRFKIKDSKYKFICDPNYPNTLPEIKCSIDPPKLEKIVQHANKFLGTYMIYDLLLLCIKKSEKMLEINDKVSLLTINYSVSEENKIKEEEFFEWILSNKKRKNKKDRATGKEMFLESSKE